MADYQSNGADPYAQQPRSPSPGRRDRERSRSPMRVDDRPERGHEERSGRSENAGNNMHVSGLSTKVDEQMLEDLFNKYGKVAKVSIVRDPHSSDSRGFGFVMMETAADAENVQQNLNGHQLEGRPLRIEKARRGRARTPTPGQYRGTGPPIKRDSHRGGDYGGGRGRYDRAPPAYYGSYAEPMRGYPPRDDRRGGGYYDDRRGGYDDRRGGGYDDRRGGYDDRRAPAYPPRDDRAAYAYGSSGRDERSYRY